jgi:hypothetical protein
MTTASVTNRGPMKDFKFDGEDGKSQHIVDAVRMDTYLVKYFDEAGKPQVRVAFIVPGTDVVRVGTQSISGSGVFVPASGWFTKQLREKTEEKIGPESI